MTKVIIATENAPQAIGPYSQAVSYNGLLYCSGQIPLDPTTGAIIGAATGATTGAAMGAITGAVATFNEPQETRVPLFEWRMNGNPTY